MDGSKLSVSIEKYNKDGSKIRKHSNSSNGMPAQSKIIKTPSFRDHRKYSDVLVGKQKTFPDEDSNPKIIPTCFTVIAIENENNVKMLYIAVIAENSEVIHLKNAEATISALLNFVKGIFSLSPTKILIVFDFMDDAVNVVSENSVLCSVFDDVRLWAEGESFDDRLIWLECFGIHPRCWSMDNVRKIGEKWGPVLSIDNKVDDVCSLTYARMLVRTKAQNKVDARIRLQYENSSYDVWIKECVWYKERQNRTVMDCTRVSFDAGADSKVLRNPKYKNGETTQSEPVCISFTNPVLVTLTNRPVEFNDYMWVDPIVVDETAGWLTVQTQTPRTCSQPVVVMSENDTFVHSQAKTPQGRPRKKTNQQYESLLPSLSNNSLEALNTWHTEKLLGISSSDEGAVISCLRKSKRLLIMDWKSG